MVIGYNNGGIKNADCGLRWPPRLCAPVHAGVVLIADVGLTRLD
jgi:hypothetical protein